MPTHDVAGAARPSALLQCAAPRPRAVLLDGGGPDSWGSGDVLYADTPSATLEVFPSGWGRWRADGVERWRWGDPLAQWEAFQRDGGAGPGERDDGAGFLTVLSYELKHWIEVLPRRLSWPRLPVLYCARYDWSYRANYRTGAARIAAARADTLAERLRWYEETMRAATDRGGTACRAPTLARPARRPCLRPTLSREAYCAMLARAHEYIAAGDIYEINLAQRFTAAADRADAPALFAAWSARYPMPFAAFVDGAAWAVVSNSPECLLLTDGARAATFPIKGTRRLDPRAADGALAAELRGDAKEHAEHVMVVDLERNDLGRVCEIGSVEVAEFATVRQYPRLLHMVSEVRGRLRDETSPAALLRAIFPGGSITGAPKIRAMQLIEELEPAARGFYTGAIGWTELDGRSRFNIAIRTALLDQTGLTYWAGGGIVADSDAEREYAETLLKSETLFRAWGSLHGRSA
jgi:para-aminobenzoate synthetase component 1